MKVSHFYNAALAAYVRNGHVKVERMQGAPGYVPDVAGASMFGRFKSKIGAQAERHLAVTQAFGRAIRNEYGEDFYRRLPAKVQATLAHGYRGITIQNARHHIKAIYESHIVPRRLELQAAVTANRTEFNRYRLNLLPEAVSHAISDLALRTNFPNGKSLAGDDFHRLVARKVEDHFSSQLWFGFTLTDVPKLTEAALKEVTTKVMPDAVLEYLANPTYAVAPRSPAEQAAGQQGAYALRGLGAPLPEGQAPPSFNRDYTDLDRGTAFGDKYRITGAKSLGVEPGFVARKQWTLADTEKMLDFGNQGPLHRYAEVASRVFLDLQTDSELLRLLTHGGAQAANLLGQLDHPADPVVQAMTREARVEWVRQQIIADPNLCRQVASPVFQQLLARVEQKQTSPRDERLIMLMRGAIEPHTAKFNKNHYLKLDYHERTLTGKLTGKYARGKRAGLSGQKWIADRAVRWWKSGTPRDLNASAVKEALANDLTRALGVPTQKLKLVESRFDNGQVKWMLDGTHVTGSRPGEAYSDLTKFMSGYGERQVLVKRPPGGPPPGGPIDLEADTSRPGLGRYKAVFTLLADVDAVGSKGQNKGTVGSEFFAIDPGHSLDESSMQGAIPRNDFAIRRGYKNFSVFDQSPFSERMRGLKETLEATKAQGVRDIFDAYRRQFGADQAAAESEFGPELDAWEASLRDRVARFEEGFRDRLAVYDFRLPPGQAALAQPQNGAASPSPHDRVLDTLDTLEKITSEHRWTQQWTDSTGQPVVLHLAYPEVDYGERQPWQVTESGDDLVFETVSASADAHARMARFCEQIGALPDGCRQSTVEGRVRLQIPKARIEDIAQLFSNDRLRAVDGARAV